MYTWRLSCSYGIRLTIRSEQNVISLLGTKSIIKGILKPYNEEIAICADWVKMAVKVKGDY